MGAGILPGEAAHRPAVVSGAAPVVGGAFLHVVLGPTHTTLVVSQLWREGLQGVGGGVISGSLGVLFTAGFSAIGAGAIFLLAFLALFAGAAHVTPSAIKLRRPAGGRPAKTGRPRRTWITRTRFSGTRRTRAWIRWRMCRFPRLPPR